MAEPIIIIHRGNEIQWLATATGLRPFTKTVSFNDITVDELAWQPSSLGSQIILTGMVIISDADTTITLKGGEQGAFLPISLKVDIPFSPNLKIPIWVGNKGENILFDIPDIVNINLILIGYEGS